MITKKRLILLVGVVAAALSLAAGAFAYFTSNGAGSGTGAVGSASPIAITASPIAQQLYPGGPTATVNINVTNNGSGSQYVNAVQLASITTSASGCDTGITGQTPAFSMSNVTVQQTVPAGQSVQVQGALAMNDTGEDQDACQGAPLTLNFTSN